MKKKSKPGPKKGFKPKGKTPLRSGIRGVGRPKGAMNKLPRELREAVMAAAELHGLDGKGTGGLTGYMFLLASVERQVFGGLLGKMLPMTLNIGISARRVEDRTIPLAERQERFYNTIREMRIGTTPRLSVIEGTTTEKAS